MCPPINRSTPFKINSKFYTIYSNCPFLLFQQFFTYLLFCLIPTILDLPVVFTICQKLILLFTMDLNSAITTEGPLQKESPGVIRLFQSRYFAIRGKGQFLVWFKKKPNNPDRNPKGIINIDTITEVRESESDDRILQIEYLERTFTLRAETVNVRDRWVNALKTIIAYHRKLNKNRKKQLENTTQSWKWKNNFNQEISEQIRLENEEAILQDDGSKKISRSQGMLAYLTNDESLFDIEKCLFYGFYSKKGVITNSERWYFLGSQVNLKDQKDEEFYNQTQTFFNALKSKNAEADTNQKEIKPRDSDSEEEMNQVDTKKNGKTDKGLEINVLYQFDEESKQLKHKYNLNDMVSYELKTSSQPFQLKITYEEIVNEEQEEVREVQLLILSDYLSEIRRLQSALRIINDKFALQKQRQIKNANKSRRYPAKKWKFAEQENWRLPGDKPTFPILVNQKQIRLNANSINMENITDHKKEEIAIKEGEEESENKDKNKKQSVYAISFITLAKETKKVYIQFQKLDIETKFHRRLQKNVKKKKEEIAEKNLQNGAFKEEDKKINPDTYLIDKKVRQTHGSIKVNFYQLMDREVIPQKEENNSNNQSKGFWDSFMGMFCGGPSTHDMV